MKRWAIKVEESEKILKMLTISYVLEVFFLVNVTFNNIQNPHKGLGDTCF